MPYPVDPYEEYPSCSRVYHQYGVDLSSSFLNTLMYNPSPVVFNTPQQWLLRTIQDLDFHEVFCLDPIMTTGLVVIGTTIRQNVHEIPMGENYA